MGFTQPARKLSRARPPQRLMSLGIWLPVLLQFATCALFQVGTGCLRAGCRRVARAGCRPPPCCPAAARRQPAHPKHHPTFPGPRLPPQVASLLLLRAQPWYARFDPHPAGTDCFDRTQANSRACSMSYENSSVFLVSLGQFLIAAFVFNKGPPFRRAIYTNLWLLLGAWRTRQGAAWWCGSGRLAWASSAAACGRAAQVLQV